MNDKMNKPPKSLIEEWQEVHQAFIEVVTEVFEEMASTLKRFLAVLKRWNSD